MKKIYSIMSIVIILLISTLLISSLDAKETKAQTLQPPKSNAVRVVVIGDSACPANATVTSTKCQQNQVAQLVQTINPQYILFAGDLQYDNGSISNYNNSFYNAWNSQLNKMYPVPGNHEYVTYSASGYKDFISTHNFPTLVKNSIQNNKTYYSYGIASWKIYSLDSNCNVAGGGFGGCSQSSPMIQWLDSQQVNDTSKCQLYIWHHPRYTSGKYFTDTNMKNMIKPLFNQVLDSKGDVIINGHDHLYEKFTNQDNNSRIIHEGPKEFIVGTGGVSLYNNTGNEVNSEKLITQTFGVMVMDLGPGGYNYNFVDLDGNVLDSGSRNCF